MLTIAGSDSSGGGGTAADVRTLSALGVFAAQAVTAVTAQSTAGVLRIHPIPPRLVGAQIDAVAQDYCVSATKIGMLARRETVAIVAGRILRRRLGPVVLDPVLAAKDGTPLLEPRGLELLKRRLLPLVALATPNAVEAGILAGCEVSSLKGARAAAHALVEMGAGAALVKGGHLAGDPVDVLFDGKDWVEFPGVRHPGAPVRGTGCLLSAAIAAGLAQEMSLEAAVRQAREFTSAAIVAALDLGRGARVAASLRPVP